MKPTIESIQAFARLWAALLLGGAKEEILARAQLDEGKWAAVCGAWALLLSESPEVREAFATALQAAQRPDLSLPTEPPLPVPKPDDGQEQVASQRTRRRPVPAEAAERTRGPAARA